MQSRCKLTSGSSGNNATMVIKDGSWKAIGGPATMNPRSASEGCADNRSHPYPQHAFGSNELGIHGTGGYHAQGMQACLTKQQLQSEQSRSMLFDLEGRESVIVFG